MAKFLMCAVRDQAVKAFNAPMLFRSVDEARRSFGDAVNDPKMEFGKHAADFSIWLLAEWDDAGKITLCEPDCIMQAVDCVPAT
uniref:DNA binding protein VP5 n=1 Tax=Gokushovirinae environmental samples TaxID=1478972 RepID=A0A2R3UAJ8_9VIRU|nr:DNA binding protein VP5 [Gokushovirinae environmental samples]